MGFRLQVENELWMESGACDEARLRALFLECDVDGSGVIEKGEFERMCLGLCVRSADIEHLFSKLDANQDGAINMEEFIRGFQTASSLSRGEEPSGAEDFTLAWEDFKNRLGEHSRFIPRIDQVSTLYHNIGLTESRMIPQYEKVLLNFTREVKLQSKEMERLALAVKRAQDQTAIQLSAMEEEMDQRIQAAERNTRVEESKKAEATLSIMREQYEAQLSELHQKVLTLQMVEDKNKSTSLKEENVILKRKNNELTLQNQKLKQELLESQTSIAILQSELDSVKSDLTDQSINLERDEALMRSFSEGRDSLERQIEILQLANRKLHDTNDGLRMTLENSQSKNKIQRVSGLSPASTIDRTKGTSTPYFERCCKAYTDDEYDQLRIAECLQTQSSDSYALALCDPMRRRSSCEVDSLDESYIDSGLSTLRSNNGYNSEQGSTGRSTPNTAAFSCSGDTSDTEVPEVQDEPQCESDSESVMNMTLNSLDVKDITAPGKKSLSPIFSEKLKNETVVTAQASAKTYKIVLAGDAAVGKSSFLLRLCKNEFKGITSTTLGVDFQMKTLVVDGVPTVLQLWDTAGQERFKSIAKSYFRRADGVLLLYDVTCERSFLNVREWVDTIEDVSQDKIPIMLVGNKTDLRQQALQNDVTCISTSLGEKLGRTYSSLFCETSAKDGSNIIEAVLHLAREVIKHAQERKHTTLGPSLSGSPSSKISSSVCCRP